MTPIRKYLFPKNRLSCLRALGLLILSPGQDQAALKRVQLVLACLEIARRGKKMDYPGFVCFENRLPAEAPGAREGLYFLLTESKGPVAFLHLSVKGFDADRAEESRELLSILYFSRKTRFVRIQPGAWQTTVDHQVQRLFRQQDRARMQKALFLRHIACGMNTI